MKKVRRAIDFDQKACLKPYINMNNEHEKWFWKRFFMLMNDAVSGKTMENVRKHKDIKLLITEAKRNYLVSEPNYHTTHFFPKAY